MNKVLIVEDEWFTRNSLINAIDWKSVDCEVAADAEDGTQALELIKLHSPDIVVSDIKMDGMDGLELCEQISKYHPNIRVILVTGYSEFEYAQQALKQGVKDFILKPTDPEELLSAVKRITREIENNRKRQEEYGRLLTAVEENIPFLQERFILELANGKPFDEKELRQRQDFLQMNFSSFFLIALEIDNYEGFLEKYGERQRQVMKLMLRDIGLEVIIRYGSGYFIEKETNLYVIFVQCRDIVGLTEELQQKIADVAEIPVSLGVSNPSSRMENLNAAYHQAVEALRQKFYVGHQCIVYYRDLKISEGIVRMVRPGDLEGLVEHMMEHVKAGNREGALSGLDMLFGSLVELKPEKSDYIKNIAFEIVILLQRLLLDMDEKPSDIFTDANFLAGISNCKVLNDIKDLLENSVRKAADLIHARNKKLSQSVVKKIIEYLNRNFDKDISLDDLGNIAYMNPKYVCRLIKKETGSNFSDILLEIRVEKAKELLRQPDLKTYEIAAKVGIEDSRYFSKVFKKYAGITPTEYRQQFVQNG